MTRALALLPLAAVLGCATTTLGRGDETNCAWRVCVEHQDLRMGRTYRVVNREPVPVTVVLRFLSVDNLRRPPEPVEGVIPAGWSVNLVHLTAIRPGRRMSARASIAIDLGASTAEHDDDHVYSVPFAGSAARQLIQGFGGGGTHMGGMRYSLDFAMPEGTPVVAAREGTVLLVQDGFTEGGLDPELLERSNLVVVAHSDGTMASYGHLSRGIVVRVGDRVLEGDLLGRSGATGFTGRPHLHFHVGLRMLRDPGRTIPIKLKDGRGRLLDLEVGALVEPGRQRPGR